MLTWYYIKNWLLFVNQFSCFFALHFIAYQQLKTKS